MFDHLKKLEVGERTARLELPEIAPKAWIEGRPANESNSRYFNAMMKKSGRIIAQAARTGRLTPEQLVQNRNADRKLLPTHVFTTWGGMEDIEDGNRVTVEFSVENAAELCRQCPEYIFDRIKNFFATSESFLTDDDDFPDHEAVAGNSKSGSSGS